MTPPAPPRLAPASAGASVDEIATPALVLDLDAMERNMARMAAFARASGRRLRPHAKTHKSARIARLQLDAGAVGVCVQKVSEAIALRHPASGPGVERLYVSNEVVDPARLAAFAALAGQAEAAIAIDSRLGAERLARALAEQGTSATVYVEIDVGQGRCGCEPAAAGSLAALARDLGLQVGGLQAYHGAAQHVRSTAERAAAVQRASEAVRRARSAFDQSGVPCALVTGGGTGTFAIDAASGVWDELQPGSYLFMDRDYADNEAAAGAPAFEHALFVKAQVISRGGDRAVIDAGHKSHAIDSGPPRTWLRRLEVVNGGDEHAILRRPAGAGPSGDADPLPALGDTVWLVPGHCDPTVNLHDEYVVLRGGLAAGRVEGLWPVDARGAVL